MRQRAANRVDDRVEASGKGDVGVAKEFLLAERPALETRLDKRGEKVLPGFAPGPLELFGNVFIQAWAFLQPLLFAENMDPQRIHRSACARGTLSSRVSASDWIGSAKSPTISTVSLVSASRSSSPVIPSIRAMNRASFGRWKNGSAIRR